MLSHRLALQGSAAFDVFPDTEHFLQLLESCATQAMEQTADTAAPEGDALQQAGIGSMFGNSSAQAANVFQWQVC